MIAAVRQGLGWKLFASYCLSPPMFLQSARIQSGLISVGILTLLRPVNAVEVQNSLTPQPLEQQVEAVVIRLLGVMDTSAQAAANPKAPAVRMTTCQVNVQQPDTASGTQMQFLYQEQASMQRLSKPYRQRFLAISAHPYSQSVESRAYRPENLSAWIGLCDKPIGDRTLHLSNLGKPICSVFLKRSGSTYVGSTPVDGCPANFRGAARITNRVVLHEDGMETWDRGFDAAGKQVWGAESESYQFRRSAAK